MRTNKYILVLLVTVTIFALSLPADAKEKLTIYTVNYPLAYFSERIGGGHVQVVFPIPADEDPAFWNPTIEQVRQFQKADLIILNGAGYAKWTRKVSLPMLRTFDTSKQFKDSLIHIESNVTHNHGPGGDHSHGGTAFTTWLDFSQAAMQAELIFNAISRKLPDQKQNLKANYEKLQEDLLELDRQMTAIGERLAQKPLFASHPVYQYLARRYDMNIKMMMWEPDEEPGEYEWQHLQQILSEHPARWMIWEGTPLEESKQRLKKLGIESLKFAPCMNKPDKGDFLTIMYDNITNLSNIHK